MDQEMIKGELAKYNITDAAIAKLSSDYMALSVTGVDDRAGLEKVHTARMDIVRRRTSIEKTRKELKADSLEYGRRVDAEAKRIVSLLEPIEEHLASQEKIVTDEIARKKTEAEAKEAARIQARVNRLFDYGARFDGQNYAVMGLMIPAAVVKSCTDEQFDSFCADIQKKVDEEAARKAEEEAKRKAEEERLAKIAAEQEAERKRLEAERLKQEEEAERIRKEHEAVEAEKKRIADAETARLKAIEDEKVRVENEKKRQIELEQARKEAAEKARVEAEEKARRDAAEKAEAERQAKIKEERRLARQPDKVKLITFADTIESMAFPCMKTDEGKEVLGSFIECLTEAIKKLRESASEL